MSFSLPPDDVDARPAHGGFVFGPDRRPFILGILALSIALLPFGGYIVGVLAILLGAVLLLDGDKSKLNYAGIGAGVLAVLINLVIDIIIAKQVWDFFVALGRVSDALSTASSALEGYL